MYSIQFNAMFNWGEQKDDGGKEKGENYDFTSIEWGEKWPERKMCE